MQCPKCNYVLNDFDSECPRCAKAAATPANTTTSQVQPVVPQSIDNGAGMMGIIGIILVAFGILGACFFFFIFNTTVQVPSFDILGTTAGGGYVNNLGLMSDRQNGILFSFGIMILGCFLMVMERSNANKKPVSQKTKTSIISAAIGIGVLLAIGAWMISNMGADVKNTFGDRTAATSSATSSHSELVRESDASSLKQLTLACFMYGQDNNNIMPNMSNAETFKAAVSSYLDKRAPDSLDVFVQADTQDPFHPNSALSKIDAAKIDNPQSVVMLYQKTPYSDGSRNVAFADGHVKVFNESDWTALKQQSRIP